MCGLIHLLPLAEPPEGETSEQRMRREVKSLYLLARGLETDIRERRQERPRRAARGHRDGRHDGLR